jgi:hypothetical protein
MPKSKACNRADKLKSLKAARQAITVSSSAASATLTSDPRRATFSKVIDIVESRFPGRSETHSRQSSSGFYDYKVIGMLGSPNRTSITLGRGSINMAEIILRESAETVCNGLVNYINSASLHELLDDCYSTFFFNFSKLHIEYMYDLLKLESPCVGWEVEYGKMTEQRLEQIKLLEASDGWVNEFHGSLSFSHSFSRVCLFNAYQYEASIEPVQILKSSKPELADVLHCVTSMIGRLEFLASGGSSSLHL